MELNEVIFIDSLPKIDLHGYDQASANVKINEFINDNICMKKEIIAIIHGRGTGKIKEQTHRTLKQNKNVLDYKLFYNNVGITIVKLNVK
ncbi:MAG: Smr/MutS family protein [Bacilli bacterium]|nr:Smr/MutS family protein [Bacilli bacterium]